MPRLISSILAASSSLLLCASACSSSSNSNPVPVDSGATAPDASGACSVTSFPYSGPQTPDVSAACGSCIESSCCSELTTCAGDPSCAALAKCVAACPAYYSSCSTGCEAAQASGTMSGEALTTCETTKCSVQCQNLSCLGSVHLPGAPPTVTFTFSPQDYPSNAPLTDATVRVCGATDVDCAKPVATYSTGSSGSVKVTAPANRAGVDGYLEVSSSTSVTTLVYLEFVQGVAALEAPASSPILSTATWGALNAAVGITPDPKSGYLAFETTDCGGFALSGATVSVSTATSATGSAFLVGGVPSTTATMTDPSGIGSLVNIPQGPATLTGKLGGMIFSSQDLLFRAGAITSTNVPPTM